MMSLNGKKQNLFSWSKLVTCSSLNQTFEHYASMNLILSVISFAGQRIVCSRSCYPGLKDIYKYI